MLTIEARSMPCWLHAENEPSRISSAVQQISSLASRISPVAIRTLCELGSAIALNSLTITFFAIPLSSPLSMLLLGNLLVLSTVPVIIKTIWDFFQNNSSKDDLLMWNVQHLASISIFNDIGLAGIIPLIHELGHATSAWICFKNPKIEINVKPYQNGSTSYYISKLTHFGSILGKNNALLLTTAAGMMASTFFGMCEIGLAECIKEKCPTLSQCLNYHAIVQILNDIIYGLMSLLSQRTDLTNDFIRLWNLGGIHPLIPITAMIALPLLEIALIKGIGYWKEPKYIQAATLSS